MVARIKKRMFRDEGLEKWILKVVHKHRRKVPPWYSLEDLVQEGYLCYWRCVLAFREPTNKGPNADQRTFMGYFVRAFSNRLVDLGKKHHETPELAASSLATEDAAQLDSWQRAAAVQSEASLAAILVKPPSEVSEALTALYGGGKGLNDKPHHRGFVEKVLPSGSRRLRLLKRRVRETTDQYYTRCLGKRGVPELVRGFLLDA